MTDEKKATGIPGVRPATKEQLPEDSPERLQLLSDEELEARARANQELINAPVNPPLETEAKTFDEEENALEWFQKKTTEGFRYWAQFTHYNIKMDDGRRETYYRVPLKKYEADEILDLSAEIQGRRSLDNDDKILSTGQVRRKERILDQLKARYYLRHAKTHKPMAPEELAHVNDSTIIDSILEACVAITVAKWAEGKK